MTVTKSNYKLRKNELYETEEWATRAVIKHLPLGFRRMFWHEPTAGNHKIADVLRKEGARVLTTDIATYSRRHNFICNYLEDDPVFDLIEVDGVIGNPPYGPGNRTALKFVEKALERCDGWVVMLLTAKFDSGLTRQHVLGNCPRFYGKVVLLDRIQWFPGKTTGTEDHAWFIWTPRTRGENRGKHLKRLYYEVNPEKENARRLRQDKKRARERAREIKRLLDELWPHEERPRYVGSDWYAPVKRKILDIRKLFEMRREYGNSFFELSPYLDIVRLDDECLNRWLHEGLEDDHSKVSSETFIEPYQEVGALETFKNDL